MEKSSKKVNILSIFLALICIGILCGIVYFKIHKKEEPKEPETQEKEEPTEPEEPDNTIEEPELKENNDEIIQKLYSIIGVNPEFRDKELVDLDSLSENVRDNIVLNALTDVCIETVIHDKAIFEAKYKEIFNQDKTLDEGICRLNGANYECSRYCNEFGEKIYSKYEKYELTENSIVIYEKAGHLDYADDGKVYLKENSLDTEAIASFDSLDDLKNSETQYKLPEYKHTFMKNEDNYYWVSSESVKQ